MTAKHLHQALAQVQELRQYVIDRQRFNGYSGRARIVSGFTALAGAAVLSSQVVPATTMSHLIGWGFIAIIAAFLNYGALLYWFLYDPKIDRDIRKLSPTLELLPPLFVGLVLTAAMILNGLYACLFGIWMCLFGLGNLATRHVLPRTASMVGIYYVMCGTVCLLFPTQPVINPWPMGIVFFIGETIGGSIMHFDRTRFID
jgi:hypothetical protein